MTRKEKRQESDGLLLVELWSNGCWELGWDQVAIAQGGDTKEHSESAMADSIAQFKSMEQLRVLHNFQI
jgi:hypothetical protein